MLIAIEKNIQRRIDEYYAKLNFSYWLTPGSGKSTYIKNTYDYDRIFKRSTIILSSDNARKELYGDINDQTHNSEVFQFIKDRAVEGIESNYTVIIDATNITRKSRKSITDYVASRVSGFDYYVHVEYVVIATPYYKCLENNLNRDRQVPEEIIKRMYKNFEFPTYKERVDKIQIVYPFGLSDIHRQEHPYKNLMETSHDTPYHRLTIGEHMEKAYEIAQSLTNDKVLLKAVELHDIGKPFCKEYVEEENGVRARFLSHANTGSYDAMFFGKACKFSDKEIVELCTLIEFHMRIYDAEEKPAVKEKLKNLIGNELYYKALLLNLADKEAH